MKRTPAAIARDRAALLKPGTEHWRVAVGFFAKSGQWPDCVKRFCVGASGKPDQRLIPPELVKEAEEERAKWLAYLAAEDAEWDRRRATAATAAEDAAGAAKENAA